MASNPPQSGNAEKRPGFWSAVKSLYYWTLLVFTTLLIGLAVLPAILFRIRPVMSRVAVVWGRTLTWLAGIHIDIENAEKFHRNGPVVIISNHQSMVDVIVFYSGLPVPFVWMAKASLFKIPIMGWGMTAAGYIPVERENRRKSQDSLMKAADIVRKYSRSVIVFPEGTRGYPDGSMRPFKKGGFLLAKRAGVVIQPVTIHGAASVMPPKQTGMFMQRIYGGNVHLVFHDPMMPEEYQDMSVEALSEHVRAVIERPLERLIKMDAVLRG